MKFVQKSATASKKKINSEPVYNEKYLRTKIKSCEGKINTNFHNNKIPKEGSKYICLSVILTNLVYKKDKNYYPEVFLGECKYVVKKKMFNYITDNINISFDDFDRENSDYSDEENSNE